MNPAIPLVCVIVIGQLAAAARADEVTNSVAPGATVSVACQACHGTNGMNPSPDIPDLAGQKKFYVTRQLQAFKSGERKHDLMTPIAGQLSDADIANLATYWASIKV